MWSIAPPQYPPPPPPIAARVDKEVIERLERLIKTAEVADKNIESLPNELAVLYAPQRAILQMLIEKAVLKTK